jgi:hypothetical protein
MPLQKLTNSATMKVTLQGQPGHCLRIYQISAGSPTYLSAWGLINELSCLLYQRAPPTKVPSQFSKLGRSKTNKSKLDL